jgi:uncharacterized protein (DUF433 family)
MSILVHADVAAVRSDPDGSVRVGSSRLLLELVVRAFQDGATPEAIATRYDSVSLAEVYAAIAYYLRHRDDVDAYLEARDELANAVRAQVEQRQGDLRLIRERVSAGRIASDASRSG